MRRLFYYFLILSVITTILGGCFRPIIRKYYFPQVGLYVTITFEDEYGYVILSRDSYVTSITDSTDYIQMRPYESTCISLLLKPECTDTIYVNDSREETYIHQKDFTFIDVDTDSTFYRRRVVNHGQDADWARPEFFDITILDYMDLVVYKDFSEENEDNDYTIAKSCRE